MYLGAAVACTLVSDSIRLYSRNEQADHPRRRLNLHPGLTFVMMIANSLEGSSWKSGDFVPNIYEII